jgi:hypothetical protein
MARCDTMKKGEIYECTKCGFKMQVVEECTTHEKLDVGACEMEMSCCSQSLQLVGRGRGESEDASLTFPTQPVYGSG